MADIILVSLSQTEAAGFGSLSFTAPRKLKHLGIKGSCSRKRYKLFPSTKSLSLQKKVDNANKDITKNIVTHIIILKQGLVSSGSKARFLPGNMMDEVLSG